MQTTKAAAEQSGDRFYLTGKPCSKGHTAPRYVCSSVCSECLSAHRKVWKAANPEKRKASEAKYRRTHAEQWRQKNRRWYISYPELRMLISARSRAKKLGLECTIRKEDIVIPKVCPVLGIPLQRGVGRQEDCSPSLDRIDTTKGYTPDNIMVISHRANTLKGDAKPHEIEALAKYVTSQLRHKGSLAQR